MKIIFFLKNELSKKLKRIENRKLRDKINRKQSTFQKKMPNDQQMRLKSERHYNQSIDKTLRVPKKQQESKVGPILLGVFLFVIVGSTLFQILNVTNQSGDDILV